VVYIVIDLLSQKNVMLVQATDEKEVEKRLSLSETQKIVGRLTDLELKVLDTNSFTVVTG